MKEVELRIPLVARTMVGEMPEAPESPCMEPATEAAPKIHLRMAMAGPAASFGEACWKTRVRGASWRKAARTWGRKAFIRASNWVRDP
jgi:hypothetical protein